MGWILILILIVLVGIMYQLTHIVDASKVIQDYLTKIQLLEFVRERENESKYDYDLEKQIIVKADSPEATDMSLLAFLMAKQFIINRLKNPNEIEEITYKNKNIRFLKENNYIVSGAVYPKRVLGFPTKYRLKITIGNSEIIGDMQDCKLFNFEVYEFKTF